MYTKTISAIIIFLILISFSSLSFSDELTLYLPSGYSEEEIEYLEKAKEIDPENYGIYYALGFAYFRKGDYSKVIECHQRFNQFYRPGSILAFQNLELAYRMIGDYRLAAYYAQKSGGVNMSSLDKQKQTREIESLARALQISPYIAGVYVQIASLNSVKKEILDEEIGYLEKAIHIDPDNFGTYYALGVAYYLKEDYDKALECASKFTQFNPACSLTFYGLGLAYYNMGDKEGVQKQIDKLYELECGYLAQKLEKLIK
ncbi:MAG: tetratricopeptide repeat protein [Candidatus Omnitrophica bacterium]|nr:tetratricopeptide repeat protein [Candidatus Omnitrophota bacterium]